MRNYSLALLAPPRCKTQIQSWMQASIIGEIRGPYRQVRRRRKATSNAECLPLGACDQGGSRWCLRGDATGIRSTSVGSFSFPVDSGCNRDWNCCFVHSEFPRIRPNFSRNAESAGILPSNGRVRDKAQTAPGVLVRNCLWALKRHSDSQLKCSGALLIMVGHQARSEAAA